MTINEIDDDKSFSSSHSSISNLSTIQDSSESPVSSKNNLSEIMQKQEIYNILHFIDRHNLDKRKRKKNDECQCNCSII